MIADEDAGLPVIYQLRLIVAGSCSGSQGAIANLARICNEHLPGQVDLHIIDIYQQPWIAEKYHVLAAPTLVKLFPLPIRRKIGDLSDVGRVLRGLEIIVLPLGSGQGV
jgi:circadian clock protein KaiB